MFLKLRYCGIIWYLFAGINTIILCSPHSLWLKEYVFSAKIWFVKTLSRIVKHESGVVKSNPVLSKISIDSTFYSSKTQKIKILKRHIFLSFWVIFCTFTPSPTTWKIKILKNWKNKWRYYHFTHGHHKWQSYNA